MEYFLKQQVNFRLVQLVFSYLVSDLTRAVSCYLPPFQYLKVLNSLRASIMDLDGVGVKSFSQIQTSGGIFTVI